MNDTMPMGCAKGVRNLNGVLQHLLQRERPFLEPGGEGLALEVSQGSRFRLDGRRRTAGRYADGSGSKLPEPRARSARAAADCWKDMREEP